DIRAATVVMQTEYDIYAPSHVVFEGLQTAAERNKFHPVQDFLIECALAWDGNPRINDLFIDYFHAQIEPPKDREDERRYDLTLRYYRAIGARSLMGAVKRIVYPGVKNDCMPNLFGETQGQGKSSAVEALFSPWYTDDLAEMGSKDSQ